ncbi:MAG: hypothetical protein ACR2J9_03550, partial [Gaiellales bacterium]
AKPSLVDNLGYGTIRPDVMITAKRGATLYGGPGRDRLEALGFRSAVFGGVGADTIVLGLRGSVADGGTGDDTIVAMGRSALLLVGGLGNDTLIGPYGSALINAYDGKGGDTVVCRSAMTRVMADAGDSISGPCKTVPVATANDPGATAPGDQIASRVATSQTTG